MPSLDDPNVTTSTTAGNWYRPGKSCQEFHLSTKFVRCLVGGRGSGKTSSTAVEVIGHCWHNPGAKVLILRKTELSQDETSIDTFNMAYDNMGTLYHMTESSLFKTWDGGKIVRLPSEEAVRRYNEFMLTNPNKSALTLWLDTEGSKWCSFVFFRGIPDESKRGNKLRGYECSLAVFIEADLMELGDFQLLLPCLRWKNAYGEFITEDAGVIIDTNPPSPRHWIAKLEESCDKTQFDFWHISTYENQHNLPPQYIERNIMLPYANNPAMIERMLFGRYAEAFDGQPVLSSFKSGVHTGDDLPFPLYAYLVRGWDFGNVNAVVWSAYWSQSFMGIRPEDPPIICEYWWDLHELYQTASDVDKQCKDVLRITAEQFPFWNDREVCAGLLDYCDPAGAAKKDTGSSISVLNTYGIYPGYKFKDRGIPKTIAIYNRLLDLKDHLGFYAYKIDRKNCPVLFAASTGGYRYPKEGEPGFGSGVPLKDGFFDHVVDGSRYSKINALRLADMEVEKPIPHTGQLAVKVNVNPPRRY